ncbi:hypothetical protein [Knoellia koreensis]|uniref:Uncharacterized protein n=1 Tax=Knoellia koreensis TaxID=2730921 RepID=A0A849HKD5_9MICO|nr:hypothetical protein [Knoellia sp. DB2414S]NNM47878.1 hypothetical protein [Knoellia sp. DB2414S]
MALGFRRHRPSEQDAAPTAESPQVRDYRVLLLQAPATQLELAHERALALLDPLTRASILRTAQSRLLTGSGLTVDEVAPLARMLVAGEKQDPGVVLAGLTEGALDRLAGAVLSLQPQATAEAHPDAQPDAQTPAPHRDAEPTPLASTSASRQ